MKKIILFISLLLCLQIEAQKFVTQIDPQWNLLSSHNKNIAYAHESLYDMNLCDSNTTVEDYLMYIDNDGKQVRLESTTLHVLSGKVEKMVQAYVDTVIDGDTYWVIAKYNGINQRVKVRLVNVDCPELEFKAKHRPEQPYSVQSKEQVANLIEHKIVSMTYFLKNQYSKPSVDQFGRPLVFISIDKQRLDDIIIYNGWGWYDNSYHTTKPYPHGKDLMELAKKDKAGLWALPDPIKPSDWRKGIMSYGKVNQNWIDTPIQNTKALTAKYKTRLDSLNNLVYDLERRVLKLEQKMSTANVVNTQVNN